MLTSFVALHYLKGYSRAFVRFSSSSVQQSRRTTQVLDASLHVFLWSSVKQERVQTQGAPFSKSTLPDPTPQVTFSLSIPEIETDLGGPRALLSPKWRHRRLVWRR